MEAGATATLELGIKVLTNEKKSFPSGEINTKYFLQQGTFSNLKADFVDGWSNQIHFVDRDERDEEPDVWDCQFAFRNRSEFPMKLERYTFVFGDENTETAVIDQELDGVIVNPGEEWSSEPWDLNSEDEPTFSENVVYSVLANVQERLAMTMAIAPVQLRVLALEGIKDFSINEIPSYRKTTIDVTIDVKTMGRAPIDTIHMEDVIPISFLNHVREDMQIIIEEREIPQDDYEFSFEPSGEDTDVERKMLVDIKDVLENIGELDDETSIIVKYPLIADKPPRDASYEAPVLFQAYTKPAGSPIEAYIQPEEITVVHRRRRTRIGKAIMPGGGKGDYKILLIYKNKGDSIKNDVKISDFIPENFEVTESDSEFEQEPQDGGTLLTWIIPEIQPGEELEINYSIHGEGDEYSLKNIEAKAFK